MNSSAAHKKFAEQFRSAGVLPTGAVSPWPQNRPIRELEEYTGKPKKVKATMVEMGNSLIDTAGMVMKGGRVSQRVRNERMETCFQCPSFIVGSERCGECGCYMAAKTWVNGNKDALCPLKKWKN